MDTHKRKQFKSDLKLQAQNSENEVLTETLELTRIKNELELIDRKVLNNKSTLTTLQKSQAHLNKNYGFKAENEIFNEEKDSIKNGGNEEEGGEGEGNPKFMSMLTEKNDFLQSLEQSLDNYYSRIKENDVFIQQDYKEITAEIVRTPIKKLTPHHRNSSLSNSLLNSRGNHKSVPKLHYNQTTVNHRRVYSGNQRDLSGSLSKNRVDDKYYFLELRKSKHQNPFKVSKSVSRNHSRNKLLPKMDKNSYYFKRMQNRGLNSDQYKTKKRHRNLSMPLELEEQLNNLSFKTRIDQYVEIQRRMVEEDEEVNYKGNKGCEWRKKTNFMMSLENSVNNSVTNSAFNINKRIKITNNKRRKQQQTEQKENEKNKFFISSKQKPKKWSSGYINSNNSVPNLDQIQIRGPRNIENPKKLKHLKRNSIQSSLKQIATINNVNKDKDKGSELEKGLDDSQGFDQSEDDIPEQDLVVEMKPESKKMLPRLSEIQETFRDEDLHSPIHELQKLDIQFDGESSQLTISQGSFSKKKPEEIQEIEESEDTPVLNKEEKEVLNQEEKEEEKASPNILQIQEKFDINKSIHIEDKEEIESPDIIQVKRKLDSYKSVHLEGKEDVGDDTGRPKAKKISLPFVIDEENQKKRERDMAKKMKKPVISFTPRIKPSPKQIYNDPENKRPQLVKQQSEEHNIGTIRKKSSMKKIKSSLKQSSIVRNLFNCNSKF